MNCEETPASFSRYLPQGPRRYEACGMTPVPPTAIGNGVSEQIRSKSGSPYVPRVHTSARSAVEHAKKILDETPTSGPLAPADNKLPNSNNKFASRSNPRSTSQGDQVADENPDSRTGKPGRSIWVDPALRHFTGTAEALDSQTRDEDKSPTTRVCRNEEGIRTSRQRDPPCKSSMTCPKAKKDQHQQLGENRKEKCFESCGKPCQQSIVQPMEDQDGNPDTRRRKVQKAVSRRDYFVQEDSPEIVVSDDLECSVTKQPMTIDHKHYYVVTYQTKGPTVLTHKYNKKSDAALNLMIESIALEPWKKTEKKRQHSEHPCSGCKEQENPFTREKHEKASQTETAEGADQHQKTTPGNDETDRKQKGMVKKAKDAVSGAAHAATEKSKHMLHNVEDAVKAVPHKAFQVSKAVLHVPGESDTKQEGEGTPGSVHNAPSPQPLQPGTPHSIPLSPITSTPTSLDQPKEVKSGEVSPAHVCEVSSPTQKPAESKPKRPVPVLLKIRRPRTRPECNNLKMYVRARKFARGEKEKLRPEELPCSSHSRCEEKSFDETLEAFLKFYASIQKDLPEERKGPKHEIATHIDGVKKSMEACMCSCEGSQKVKQVCPQPGVSGADVLSTDTELVQKKGSSECPLRRSEDALAEGSAPTDKSICATSSCAPELESSISDLTNGEGRSNLSAQEQRGPAVDESPEPDNADLERQRFTDKLSQMLGNVPGFLGQVLPGRKEDEADDAVEPSANAEDIQESSSDKGGCSAPRCPTPEMKSPGDAEEVAVDDAEMKEATNETEAQSDPAGRCRRDCEVCCPLSRPQTLHELSQHLEICSKCCSELASSKAVN